MHTRSPAKLFEAGIAEYFQQFGHRRAREVPHQSWLLMTMAKLIDPQLVIAELTLPRQDLSPFGEISVTKGAINFDFAVSRSEIDLRTWKSRTPGWGSGTPTSPRTLETLKEVDVLAEFKITESSYTSGRSLTTDLEKLRSAIGFMDYHGCDSFPDCFLIVLDRDRVLDIESAVSRVAPRWPVCAPFPKVIVGP